MKSILNKLIYEHMSKRKNFEGENEISLRLKKNEKKLKSNLNKKEKRLLLRIVDDKDLMKEEISVSSYLEGFKLGLKIGYESNKD